jgi:hypothetical protein
MCTKLISPDSTFRLSLDFIFDPDRKEVLAGLSLLPFEFFDSKWNEEEWSYQLASLFSGRLLDRHLRLVVLSESLALSTIQNNSLQRRRVLCCSTVHTPKNFSFRSVGISALPKGLISWFLGYQYPRSTPSGSTSRSHQSPAASSFSECLPPVRGQTPRLVGVVALSAPPGTNPQKNGCQPFRRLAVPERHVAPSQTIMSKSMTLTEEVNTSSTKRIGQSRLPRFLFTEEQTWVKVAPKPSDEGSLSRLRNPFLRDRVVQWNRQRNYHVHPYWTDNLKYVC